MDLKTLKNTALIGHTGFVGSNLLQQNSFDHTYNSKNFRESEGSNFGLVVCAGISAVKWLALVLRLPSLFGPGLKKNAIFDLLTNSNIDQINPAGKFQWYPVVRLWDDIKKAAAADLHLLNISTEPITTSAIAKNFFPRSSLATTSGEPSSYDVWSIHAEKFDKDGHYLLDKADVTQALSDYLAANEYASKAY
jgi:hypothetical protein